MKTCEVYNGWKNKETWNIALWLENDESMYYCMVAYARRHAHPTYRGFIVHTDLYGQQTPDGYRYDSARLDYKALTELIRGSKGECYDTN